MEIQPLLTSSETSFLISGNKAAASLRTLWGWVSPGNPPSNAYRFVDHARYLGVWFETLGVTSNITPVIHDWGSALGFHRAARYPEQIKAIAYMEAIAMPLRWDDFGEVEAIFRGLRSEMGERMVLDENFFVERILPLKHIAQAQRRGDGRLPRTVSGAGSSATDSCVAASTSHRR
jgi:pimeloyl-ACP methyl ester carboxylesterase